MQRYSIRKTTKNCALAKRNSISNEKILMPIPLEVYLYTFKKPL